MDFVRLEALRCPRKVAELTPEARNFKNFKLSVTRTENFVVSAMAFQPQAPYDLAVCAGPRVSLYKTLNFGDAEHTATVAKFKDVVQCVAYRPDGRLLIAGESSGSAAVVDVASKSVLRRFRGHGDVVTCCGFGAEDKSTAATGAKDGKLRLWDVSTGDLVQTIDAHNDRLKCLVSRPASASVWLTGGYDSKVRLWDFRMKTEGAGDNVKAAMELDHGAAVEAATVFPSGSLFASAGGPDIKLWDLAAGGRFMEVIGGHAKVVTSACLDSTASVLLTTSFDGSAKVHDTKTFGLLWTYNLKVAATCSAWCPTDQSFAVGLEGNQWLVRGRRKRAAEEEPVLADDLDKQFAKAKKQPLPALDNPRKFNRGQTAKPEPGDDVISDRRLGRKEGRFDFFLRKFEYRKVVDAATSEHTTADVGLAVLDELIQRGDLKAALRNRDEESCASILRWLARHIGGDSPYRSILLETFHSLLDVNPCLSPPTSPTLIDLLTKISGKIQQELRIQESFQETIGAMDAALAG